jgi:hypothetical protein
METFAAIKKLVDNPDYLKQREDSIGGFDINSIDSPIVEIIEGFLKLPYCFTLQSCYGHFIYRGQKDPFNTAPLPVSSNSKTVKYKIAYIALCIQNNKHGKELLDDLSEVPRLDSKYVQIGCAEWFWKRYLNSFALQVEPQRYMYMDTADISYKEALHIETVRNSFFNKLAQIIQQRK